MARPCSSTAVEKDTGQEAKETLGKGGTCLMVTGKACYPGSQPMRGPLTKSFYQKFPQNCTERWKESGSHAT